MMIYSASDYAALLAQIKAASDEKYKKFNDSLVPGMTNSYGVRVPQLRALAKEICKGDWRGFLALSQLDSYEETMLRGMVIARAKCDTAEKLSMLKGFIPHIDNWAINDVVTGDCKWKPSELVQVWEFFVPYLQSGEEFAVRFAVTQMMSYFLVEEYIDRVLALYQQVSHSGYYVQMALAWALSVCFVKYRDKTLPIFQAKTLPDFVHNKGIQKCRESFRVSAEDKAYLNTLKIK